MRLERARFIRAVIEGAETLSAARAKVVYAIPEGGYFEYGMILQNHIRHCLATLLKHKQLPGQEEHLHLLKQQLSHIIDKAVDQQLLNKNTIIPVSYRETFDQSSDMAEVSRLQNIWWYPGLATSSHQKGCYVPVYNTANAATKDAFNYHLETSLHSCLAEAVISSKRPFSSPRLGSSSPQKSIARQGMRVAAMRHAL